MKMLSLVLCFISSLACAQTPLKSAAFSGPWMTCGVSAFAPDLMPIDGALNWNTQNATAGAGVWPAGQNLTVRKVCLTHSGNFTAGQSYAVSGHSGINGDHVTPFIPDGVGTQCLSYDGAPVVVTGGEYFDVHAGCNSGTHRVMLQIWYTQP